MRSFLKKARAEKIIRGASKRPDEKTKPISRITEAKFPTKYGRFKIIAYEDSRDRKLHLALVKGNVAGQEKVLVRVHSECLTGDALSSMRCDCGEQLQTAMSIIERRKKGVVLYLRQEGRGIGLLNKMIAYHMQDMGADTVEANVMLGFDPDERSYDIAAFMLGDLGVRSVVLLTNNPDKIEGLKAMGISVSGRKPLVVGLNRANLKYMITKKRKLNHMLDLDRVE